MRETRRIVTVTLNPAVDMTVGLTRLIPGEVQRAKSAMTNAGGKGVNVAACLGDWGADVAATGVLGAENARLFADLFAEKKVTDAFIRVPGATRVNVKLTADNGETTDINLPGLSVTAENLALLESTLGALKPEYIVLAGSLPASVPSTAWADIATFWHAKGAKVLLDVSGPALAEALSRKNALPYVIKPNADELSAIAGKKLSHAEVLEKARALHAEGVALVVISLGSDGALFISDEGEIRAVPLKVNAASTVGAGDAMVAGLTAAIAEGAPLERIARLSTAFAAGKLRRIGPHLPSKEDIEKLAASVTISPVTSWLEQKN